jgi:hypothetical protein
MGLLRRRKSKQHALLESRHHEFIEGTEIAKCWGCGAKTNRVDLSWGAHICSVGCRAIVDLRAEADMVREVNADYPEDNWWLDGEQRGEQQFWET